MLQKKKEETALALPANHPLAMDSAPAFLSEPSPVRAMASDSFPWIGHATRKTGSSGGDIDWAALKSAGVENEGEAYLVREGVPYPLAGVPVVLCDMVLVGQQRNEATFQVEHEWHVDELPTEDDGVRYCVRAVLLVPGDDKRPHTVAFYTDDLSASVGYQSRVIVKLRDELATAQKAGWAASHPTAAKLPPVMRIVGYLGGTMSSAKGSGRTYVKRSIKCDVPDLEAVAGLVGAMNECADDVTRACEMLRNIGGEAPAGEPAPF